MKPVVVNGAKRQASTRTILLSQQVIVTFLGLLLLLALGGNYVFWLRLMRDAEALHNSKEKVRYITVKPQFEVKLDTRQWMSKAFLGGQIYLPDELTQQDSSDRTEVPHGVLVNRLPEIRRLCMYSERCSGSTWINSLLRSNFHIDQDEAACPNKHDYENSVPNEFLFPAADTLVLVVVRNAFDWAASFYNTPWGAANHCNVSFPTFLTREWGPGELRGTKPYCPKYENDRANYMHTRVNMYYEATQGRNPADVMELRRWKLQRQVDLCSMRQQSACVQYEGVLADWRGWLMHMRDTFNLQPKRGFPSQVDHYKGLKDHALFTPHSHYASLKAGQHTTLFNETTVAAVQQRLDLRLEGSLGYEYDRIGQLHDGQQAQRTPPSHFRHRHWH